MENNNFYSKSIREKSPTFSLGVAKIISGIILLFYSFSGLLKIEPFINGMIHDDIDSGLAAFPEVIIAVFLFFISISFFLNGLKNLKTITITPNDPPEFSNYQKVIDSMIKGKLDIYRLPDYGPLKFAYNYISDKIPFLKPSQRKVVEMNVSFMRKYIFLLVIVTLAFFFREFIHNEIFAELEIQNNLIAIPYAFLILLLIFLILSFYTIFLLIPGSIPKQEVKEEIASIRGGGDPNQFCPLLEKAFYKYRFNNLPNRKDKTGFSKVEELSFNETGSFEGSFVMETHPKYIGSIKSQAAPQIFIFIAIASLIISLFYFSNIDVVYGDTTSFLSGAFSSIAGTIFFRTSVKFFRRTSLILNCFTFESYLVAVEIEGTIGKTEITAGKAITDSIETRNTVIRSDSQLKVYATLIQSENKNVSDKRYITAMITDDSVDEILMAITSEINNFRDEGVTVRGVDITSESISQLTNANVKIQAAKRSIQSDRALKESNVLSLENPASKSDMLAEHNNSDTKECPQCAETIKAKAKLCRFCRYEFE